MNRQMTHSFLSRLQSNFRTVGYSLFLFMVFWGAFSVHQAEASQGVTFQWKRGAEPDILGYRLYYGDHSRFSASAAGEGYNSYLDLISWERCSTDSNRPACETLGVDEITCTNLEGSRPQCTVKGLSGGLKYFAVTSYNPRIESDFSRELHAMLDSNGNLVPSAPARPAGTGGTSSPYNVSHLPSVFEALFDKNG